MLFKKLLDKITSNKDFNNNISFDNFDNELNLAISILMIEVSKSDDEFTSIEKNKIITLLQSQFNLTKPLFL